MTKVKPPLFWNVFDGEALARGWLSTAVAAGKNPDRPVLDRTVLVEWHAESGVRLVATDGWMISTTWVAANRSGLKVPDYGDAPDKVVVASDVAGRGANLLTHVVKITKGENASPCDLRLSIETVPGEALLGQMGDEQVVLVIELEGTEKVILPVVAGEYVPWRNVLDAHRPPMPPGVLRLSSALLARAASTARNAGTTEVDLRPSSTGVVAFDVTPDNFDVNPISGLFLGRSLEDAPEPESSTDDDDPEGV